MPPFIYTALIAGTLSGVAGAWGGYEFAQGQCAQATLKDIEAIAIETEERSSAAATSADAGARETVKDQQRALSYEQRIQAHNATHNSEHPGCLGPDGLRLWNEPASWPTVRETRSD